MYVIRAIGSPVVFFYPNTCARNFWKCNSLWCFCHWQTSCIILCRKAGVFLLPFLLTKLLIPHKMLVTPDDLNIIVQALKFLHKGSL